MEIIEIGWDELPTLEMDWVDENVDLFILGGGGYLSLDADGRLAPRVERDIALLRGRRRPVATLCPGLNLSLVHAANIASAAAKNKETLGCFVDMLAQSSVRDLATWTMLESIRPGRTECLPDPALFLSYPKPSARAPGPAAQIGLNLAFHGAEPSRLLVPHFRLFCDVARGLARTTPCRFIYFVHYESERLVARLFHRAGLDIEVESSTREFASPGQ